VSSVRYSDLVRILQNLEYIWQGNCHVRSPKCPSSKLIFAGKNVQYFACDNKTFLQNPDLRVVVAIGINYSQGANCLPGQARKKVCAVRPWVEDNLHQWPYDNRGALKFYFNDYKSRPQTWVADAWASSAAIPISEQFHLVETNFCPWITKSRWSDPQYSEALRADLLVNPPNRQKPLFQHIDDLVGQLGLEKIIWVGHGYDAVSQLFRMFTRKHSPRWWLIVPNLSVRFTPRKKS
jgi:hypothetical protein